MQNGETRKSNLISEQYSKKFAVFSKMCCNCAKEMKDNCRIGPAAGKSEPKMIMDQMNKSDVEFRMASMARWTLDEDQLTPRCQVIPSITRFTARRYFPTEYEK